MSVLAPTLRNESAKLRHLHVVPTVAALGAGLVLLTLFTVATSGEDAPTWALPLAGFSFAAPLVCPLLVAVVASRVVDVEHQGNGWLLGQALGRTPGALCRAKLAVTGALVAVAVVAASVAVVALGLALGVTGPLPVGAWVGTTACVVAVSLALLALHLLLSAVVDNQLVCLGIGVVGTVLAVFSSGLPGWVAHATPWGYYGLGAAADYVDGDLTMLTPSYASVAALAVVAAVLFTVVTARFDRQEA
jgi:hypothetical protein